MANNVKKYGWLIFLGVLVLIGFGIFAWRQGWLSRLGLFRKTIDGDKGTAPEGCDENMVNRSSGRFYDMENEPYYYKFNRPYFRYKKGDKIIGVCKYVGREFNRYDCDTIEFYENGKRNEIDGGVLDKLDRVIAPVIGLVSIWGCSAPIYNLSLMPNASEVCFIADDLGLERGDVLPLIQRIAYRNLGTKIWRFNKVIDKGEYYQYCYVYNPDGNYPTL